jgi:hypothetical protein
MSLDGLSLYAQLQEAWLLQAARLLETEGIKHGYLKTKPIHVIPLPCGVSAILGATTQHQPHFTYLMPTSLHITVKH